MRKKNLRLTNLNEFLDNWKAEAMGYKGAFEILGDLETKLNTKNFDKNVLISYKDEGYIIFEFVKQEGFRYEDEIIFYFKYMTSVS
jgi:hypothetical protein